VSICVSMRAMLFQMARLIVGELPGLRFYVVGDGPIARCVEKKAPRAITRICREARLARAMAMVKR